MLQPAEYRVPVDVQAQQRSGITLCAGSHNYLVKCEYLLIASFLFVKCINLLDRWQQAYVTTYLSYIQTNFLSASKFSKGRYVFPKSLHSQPSQ